MTGRFLPAITQLNFSRADSHMLSRDTRRCTGAEAACSAKRLLAFTTPKDSRIATFVAAGTSLERDTAPVEARVLSQFGHVIRAGGPTGWAFVGSITVVVAAYIFAAVMILGGLP